MVSRGRILIADTDQITCFVRLSPVIIDSVMALLAINRKVINSSSFWGATKKYAIRQVAIVIEGINYISSRI